MAHGLKHTQRLLYRLITAPDGVAPGLKRERARGGNRLAALVRGDRRLSAVARVSIYANMYFFRLLDVLKEDYPALLNVLGEDRFHDLAVRYLAAHPPDNPSVLWCGRGMADYLRRDELLSEFPFLADLARLERSIIEVFVAPDAPALTAPELSAVPAEKWPALEIRTGPALKILSLKWRVSDLVRAVEGGKRWRPPIHQRASTLVWRRRNQSFHRDLEPPEARALNLATRGAELSSICEVIARDVGQQPADIGQQPAETINRLLTRWVTDGLLLSPARV